MTHEKKLIVVINRYMLVTYRHNKVYYCMFFLSLKKKLRLWI